jgi:uncharacterized protein YggT (Ycf19 family)
MIILFVLYYLLYVLEILIIISFFIELLVNINPYILNYKFIDFLRNILLKITNPMVGFLRKNINTNYKMFDFSYIIIFLFIEILKKLILIFLK